ncbi:hypothetical protein [Streptomyces sp. NPDC000410]|uniref:hypothetical protein n=1 Tax=Streptomyces sp. NPDC000410 TaxID=3154254 RepID=UPI003330DC1E
MEWWVWLLLVLAVLGLLALSALTVQARRRYLRFARHWPWTGVITDALARLEALPNPG